MIKKDVIKKYAGFTLVEMLIVLFVIAVLVLLFVPSLSNQRESIEKKGDEAFRQVVTTQVELYVLNEEDGVSYEGLVSKKYLTQKQVDKAKKLAIDLNNVSP